MHKEIRALCARTAFYRRERRSVLRAREFARTALTDWGLDHLADDVLLCVSELATNALLHGVPPGRGYRLCLSLDESGLLRVEVHDSGAGEPRLPVSLPCDGGEGECESGRGLLLVSALADAWGIGERVPGKIVWCEFRCYGKGYGKGCSEGCGTNYGKS
ncbi:MULTISPECIES: ATP-binding protein [unclassified Streptomyces]|uniref:ATP-binding protein n=1 Tax=unclassified Streptomyces TaxID=2593676 RepID=UPI000882D571|nr:MULTISPECIES: ATP-binding protein [unclassified Streptomyces]PBC85221.1 anti-sigma regulatory factor (Ser/Thr protein kinase) [Streptomyces sp. 2321.6]SDR19823.1 Anti-sigma regulatory factor (Ser/Thr protein kinase) [Streptomyces sp. KS_16]SED60171.1 Anti-sigma regulatory factor (Ser/Thr protein kinase) [Streptomyces sp. 2133.1]SEE23692.1 Anti-sigma regulatory factor (Ser/Thr protein kinase) [Streptomyces sp. 2112.3]SNC71243.1 Anti-sigma regulatory factor (Ser/Thr protein kinase) [Streptomy